MKYKYCFLRIITSIAICVSTFSLSCSANQKPKKENLLRYIMGGIGNYAAAQGRLPSSVHQDHAMRPLYSWRFSILPYIESGGPRRDLDKSWYAPANSAESGNKSFFYCLTGVTTSPACYDTNVVAITGEGTAFDGKPHTMEELPGDLILLITVAKSGIHWMEPGDVDITDIPDSIAAGITGKGVHVAFADGNVWFLRRDVPIGDIKRFFTIEGAKTHDRQELLAPYHATAEHEELPSAATQNARRTICETNEEEVRRNAALSQIEGVGGRVLDRGLMEKDGYTQILLGPEWQGGNNGLTELSKLGWLDELTVDCTKIGDAGLQHLAQVQYLKSLYLLHSDVSSNGIHEIKELCPKLTLLKLEGNKVSDETIGNLKGLNLMWLIMPNAKNLTDAGIHDIGSMKNLFYLDFSGTNLTGSGFARVSDFHNLRALFLADTKIDDNGLGCIVAPNVYHLDLSGTRVTEAGLKHLKRFKKLRELNLANTRLSDNALLQLAELSSLEVLSLDGNDITNVGMEHLKQLKYLKVLSVKKTRNSKAALTTIRKAIPGLNVITGNSEESDSDNPPTQGNKGDRRI